MQKSIVCVNSVTGRASKIVQHTHRLCTYVTVGYASGLCDHRLCCVITLYIFCIKQIGCGRGPCTVYGQMMMEWIMSKLIAFGFVESSDFVHFLSSLIKKVLLYIHIIHILYFISVCRHVEIVNVLPNYIALPHFADHSWSWYNLVHFFLCWLGRPSLVAINRTLVPLARDKFVLTWSGFGIIIQWLLPHNSLCVDLPPTVLETFWEYHSSSAALVSESLSIVTKLHDLCMWKNFFGVMSLWSQNSHHTLPHPLHMHLFCL